MIIRNRLSITTRGWWFKEPRKVWFRADHWLLLQPPVRGEEPAWRIPFVDWDWGAHFSGWRAHVGPWRLWYRPDGWRR